MVVPVWIRSAAFGAYHTLSDKSRIAFWPITLMRLFAFTSSMQCATVHSLLDLDDKYDDEDEEESTHDEPNHSCEPAQIVHSDDGGEE